MTVLFNCFEYQQEDILQSQLNLKPSHLHFHFAQIRKTVKKRFLAVNEIDIKKKTIMNMLVYRVLCENLC